MHFSEGYPAVGSQNNLSSVFANSPGGLLRTKTVLMKLTDEEKKLMDREAKSVGLQTASWARSELLKRATNEEDGPPRAPEYESDRDIPLLSLFCGSGGLDEGFRQTGFRTDIAVDVNDSCVKTFAYNHPGATVVRHSVTDLTVEKLDEWHGAEFKPVGVIGGPPCQSFSVSNVHQKDDDDRHLLPEAYASLLSLLNKRNPISFFLFENVPGLLGKKHRERYERFKQRFIDAGFDITEDLLDAENYGVPQERPRVFIVGINRDLHPEAKWQSPEPEGRSLTVRSAIHGLPEPVLNERGLDPDKFPVHPNHWCLVPRSEKFKNSRLEEGQMYGRSFRTLTWDKPSWTVAYGHREVHVHPGGHRRLSIYEAMRLQSFPKQYRLLGHMSAQIQLVSDAVPPRLAWHIASSIRRAIGL